MFLNGKKNLSLIYLSCLLDGLPILDSFSVKTGNIIYLEVSADLLCN